MDADMERLNTYFEDIKKNGGRVPSRRSGSQPHLRVISAGAGIGYRHLLKPPYRRRVTLAVREIGLENKKRAAATTLKTAFERNRKLICSYLEGLEARGLKLPEDPTHMGDVLFEQAEIESGVNCNSLTFRGIKTYESYKVRLRETVTSAIPRIGLEVRILPEFLRHNAGSITYKLLLEKGTVERTNQLKGKRNPKPQLYNTRYALNKFLKAMRIEKSATVGQEFTLDFANNVEMVIGELQNGRSRKKFQAEIRWWQSFYKRLIKEQSIPREFHEALSHLVDTSGLSFRIVAKLIGVSRTTLLMWCGGVRSPSHQNIRAVSRAESIFKLPSGALVDKVSRQSAYGHFRPSQLPDFLKETPKIALKVKAYLPNDFCEMTSEKQREIVDAIYSEIAGGDNLFGQKQTALQKLPYRLREWPERLGKEFDDLAAFKIAERPPIGMQRNGTWVAATKELVRRQLSYLFGSICLSPDADDIRLRGLGVPQDDLTLALLVCPRLVDWHVRFRFENRSGYTDQTIRLIYIFISLIRAETGWLRQHPELASRLRPISWNTTELVPPELITEARSAWDSVCDKAVSYYENLISEIERLIHVRRDPFHPINGIVKMDDPMEAFGYLIREMRDDLPNRLTQPTHYHGAVRNCAIVALLAVTGLRRRTLSELNYTGDNSGNLYLQGGTWVLSIPRSFFKSKDCSYFGPRRAPHDYYMELPDVYGLAEIFSEYLNVSRPYLLSKYHPGCIDHPLFVHTYQGKGVRLTPKGVSRMYVALTEKYIAEKKYRGTGIPGVKKHGPHAARHIRGTAVVKKTGSLEIAADANHHSVETARGHYALFLPKDRNRRVNDALFGEREGKH